LAARSLQSRSELDAGGTNCSGLTYEMNLAKGTCYQWCSKKYLHSVQEGDLMVNGAMSDVKGDLSKGVVTENPVQTAGGWRIGRGAMAASAVDFGGRGASRI